MSSNSPITVDDFIKEISKEEDLCYAIDNLRDMIDRRIESMREDIHECIDKTRRELGA